MTAGGSAFFCFWKRHTDMSDVPYSYASAYQGMDCPYSTAGYHYERPPSGAEPQVITRHFCALLGYPRLNPALTCRCLEAATRNRPEVVMQPCYCILIIKIQY